MLSCFDGIENDKKILMTAMSESQGWKGQCHARHLSSGCKFERLDKNTNTNTGKNKNTNTNTNRSTNYKCKYKEKRMDSVIQGISHQVVSLKHWKTMQVQIRAKKETQTQIKLTGINLCVFLYQKQKVFPQVKSLCFPTSQSLGFPVHSKIYPKQKGCVLSDKSLGFPSIGRPNSSPSIPL